MTSATITLSLHRAGEPSVDLDDLWAQMGVPHERFALTIKARPHPLPRRFQVTLNDQVI